MIFLCIYFYKKSGRGQGIRTLGGFHLAGFQNRYNRPTLSILYNLMVRMVRIELTLRNRNGILSPARLPIPPHSHMCIKEFKSGGSRQNRTVDTRIFNPLLYRLSYRTLVTFEKKVVVREGFEPSKP